MKRKALKVVSKLGITNPIEYRAELKRQMKSYNNKGLAKEIARNMVEFNERERETPEDYNVIQELKQITTKDAITIIALLALSTWLGSMCILFLPN